MTVDLAVLGNLLLDDVVYEDGRTRMAQPGGAVLYVALGARLWGVSVGLVTVLGDDYPISVLDALAEHGIDLGGARPLNGPTLRTWLLYEGRQRQLVHRLGGPSHAEVSPTAADLPSAWSCRAVHLAPMPWDFQRRQIAELADRGSVQLSLDPYELLTAAALDDWRQLLAGIDLLFLSEDEMMIDGALERPQPVLESLCGGRLRRLFFKRGGRGGLVYTASREDSSGDRGSWRDWSARAAGVIDPTGAGDAFAGGALAGLLFGEPLPQALERAVVSASFALEGEGADGLFSATPERAERRRAEWFQGARDSSRFE